MKITPNINTITYSKYNAAPRNKNSAQPAFTGIFNIFGNNAAKDVFVNSGTKILSKKQLQKLRENIVDEIYSLFKSHYTPAASKRMDELLNSPYIDYNLECAGSSGLSLADCLEIRHSQNENKLYNQFVRTSLAKTMPFEAFEDPKSIKELYYRNNAIFQIFQSYTKMDETSKEAKEVRDMVVRMKDNNVEINDYPEFFADCLAHGKLKMCKLLEAKFGINPETTINVVKRKEQTLTEYSKTFGTSTLIANPYYKISRYDTDSHILVYHPQKLDKTGDYSWKITGSEQNMILWDFAACCQDKNSKEFFDIPKYIFTTFYNKPGHKSFHTFSDLTRFLWSKAYYHPEMKSLDFVEQMAKYFRQKAGQPPKARVYLNFLPANVLDNNDYIKYEDEAFERIKKLKSDFTKDNSERIKVLEELYMMFGEANGKEPTELAAKLKAINPSSPADFGGDAFKVYEDVISLSMLNLHQKRELLEKLIKNKSNLIDCKLGDMLNVKFLPKTRDEYSTLVAKLSHSIGIYVKKLPPELKAGFYNAMDRMSAPNSEFMRLNFDNSVRRLRQEYPLEEFQKDIWYAIKDLSNIERGKVLDYFGFELKNENGKLILNGFPNSDYTEQRLAKVDDKELLNKIREVQAYVIEFTQNNSIRINDNPEASKDITDIVRAFPEFLTSVGKLQSRTHDFSVDIHTLKVLQEIFKNPEYQKLPDSSKRHLQIAALFHDLTKQEGIVDKLHSASSAFDTYYLTGKLDMPESDKLKIYNIIKNHTWLEAYKGDTTELRKQLAFEFSQDDSFKLISILTDADLKAVKKEGKFFTRYEKNLQNAKAEIEPLIYDIQKTAINLPQTKIPKAHKLNLSSPYVEKITADGVTNTVVHLKQGINLKEAGFGSDISLEDLNILVHGLDDKDSASMFQALGIVNSDALLSTSYINYGKGNWKVFRKQGFVLSVPSSDIHAGYWRDFGSGYKKDKNDLIKNYIFSDSETRTYFSRQLKNELNLNDDEYIDLFPKIANRPIEKLDKTFPEVAKAYRRIFSNMETAKRSMGRNYNEILVTRPKIQAIFCWDKSPEHIPLYLRKFAAKHDLPVLVFE